MPKKLRPTPSEPHETIPTNRFAFTLLNTFLFGLVLIGTQVSSSGLSLASYVLAMLPYASGWTALMLLLGLCWRRWVKNR